MLSVGKVGPANSAPKSVSVLYALGDTQVVAAVEAAHTEAVLQSIASLSPRIAYTRTGHAGVAVVDAEGVFGIRYGDTVLVEFSTRSVDIESELENWVSGFVEREGRKPSPVEVGKAHKTITLATRTAKPVDAGLPARTYRSPSAALGNPGRHCSA